MKSFNELRARVRAVDVYKQDVALAVVLTVGALIEGYFAVRDHPHPGLTLLALVGVTVTVAWRRRAPARATAAALLLFAVSEQLMKNGEVTMTLFAMVLNFYSLGARRPGHREELVDVLLLALAVGVIAIDPSVNSVLDAITPTALFAVLPLAVGRALASRRALIAELRERARRLEAEREETAQEAVTEERTRIARELHDIVAHCVSVMVIQTGAARSVARNDRAAAREALGAVESSGREALAEMRRMVGVLHKGDVELADTAPPGLSQLAALATRARAAGLPVEVHVEGQPRELPTGLDLAAYRVIQEALTNAIKHAGGARARVVVQYAPSMLELEVSDDGVGPAPLAQESGSGHGLIGMRERLRLYGGELRSGRRRGGGFAVSASIPLEREMVA
ncbi:MAG: sensor histidine kinase [Solirubrobacteraceae bacterium]